MGAEGSFIKSCQLIGAVPGTKIILLQKFCQPFLFIFAYYQINGRILYRNGEFNTGESVETIYARCDKIVKRIMNA